MNAFSICKGLLARLNPRNNSSKETFPCNELVPYSVSYKSKIEIIAPTKYIVKIPVAYIIVPLFDGNNDSITLELKQGGEKAKQVTCQLKKWDAYIVYCKTHVDKKSTKCRHNSFNCALQCYRRILIANYSLQLQGFQALVMLYILPSNEQLQPPQEVQKEQDEESKQEEHNEETNTRFVSYDEKLFKLVNNVGDGLCLFYSVSSFFKELHSQEYSTFPVKWSPYIIMTDSKTFSGPQIIRDLAEFLCTIGEADLDALKECYGEYYSDDENDIEDDIEKEDKVLPLKNALFVDKVRLKTEESKNKGIVKWMNNYI
jgi:hypothetical protein